MFGKKKRKEEKPIPIALPITPMLDMSFQILFYFIMQFRPPISEGQLDFNLPKLEANENMAPDNQEKLDETPEEYKMTVLAPFGAPISPIRWKPPNSAVEDITFDESDKLGYLKAIEEKLKTISKPGNKADSKPPTIKIEAADKLSYGNLINIMDLCRRMGFNDVGLMPVPKKKFMIGGAPE